MLINTPNGVRHTGRVEPQSTHVPSRREVALAILRLTERLKEEGLHTPDVAQYLDTIWTHFVTH